MGSGSYQMRCGSLSRRRYLASAGGACLAVCLGSMFHPVVIYGTSMEPALHARQLVWMDRTYYWFHRPKRGEVIVFQFQGETYVKRIYRGPGRRMHCLEVRGGNIGPIRESSLAICRERLADASVYRIVRLDVPDDGVYVLGDNTSSSIDSRSLGPIPIGCVLGRVRTSAGAHVPPIVEFSLPPLSDRGAVRRSAHIPVSVSPGLPRRLPSDLKRSVRSDLNHAVEREDTMATATVQVAATSSRGSTPQQRSAPVP